VRKVSLGKTERSLEVSSEVLDLLDGSDDGSIDVLEERRRRKREGDQVQAPRESHGGKGKKERKDTFCSCFLSAESPSPPFFSLKNSPSLSVVLADLALEK